MIAATALAGRCGSGLRPARARSACVSSRSSGSEGWSAGSRRPSSSSGRSPSASTRSTGDARARRPARDDGRGRRRLRGVPAARRPARRGPLGQELRLTLRSSRWASRSRRRSRTCSPASTVSSMRAFVQAIVQGQIDGCVDREDPPRPRHRDAEDPAPEGGGARAEGADEAPVPARRSSSCRPCSSSRSAARSSA